MTYRHPSGINLSPVPGDHVLRPKPTIESVLREQAVEIHAWMRCEADDYLRFCEARDAYSAVKIAERYRVLVMVYHQIADKWKSLAFDGHPQPEAVHETLMANVRAIMKEREADIPY